MDQRKPVIHYNTQQIDIRYFDTRQNLNKPLQSSESTARELLRY